MTMYVLTVYEGSAVLTKQYFYSADERTAWLTFASAQSYWNPSWTTADSTVSDDPAIAVYEAQLAADRVQTKAALNGLGLLPAEIFILTGI
jgi:hypothetical protein